MKIKAIIFDMDGTVIDTEHIWDKATKDLLAHRNVILNQEEYIKVMNHTRGIGLTPGCEYLKECFNITDEIPTLIQELRKRAHQGFYTDLRFIEGFTNFHRLVRAQGLKNGIATNADKGTVHIVNQALKLNQFFGKHIYDITHVQRPKPDPAIYLHTAAALGTDPADCIAIEDSAHGVAAAKNAGIFCIGINTAKNRDNLKQADLIIEGYQDLDLIKISTLK